MPVKKDPAAEAAAEAESATTIRRTRTRKAATDERAQPAEETKTRTSSRRKKDADEEATEKPVTRTRTTRSTTSKTTGTTTVRRRTTRKTAKDVASTLPLADAYTIEGNGPIPGAGLSSFIATELKGEGGVTVGHRIHRTLNSYLDEADRLRPLDAELPEWNPGPDTFIEAMEREARLSAARKAAEAAAAAAAASAQQAESAAAAEAPDAAPSDSAPADTATTADSAADAPAAAPASVPEAASSAAQPAAPATSGERADEPAVEAPRGPVGGANMAARAPAEELGDEAMLPAAETTTAGEDVSRDMSADVPGAESVAPREAAGDEGPASDALRDLETDPEFARIVDRICQNIGVQEMHAGMEEDISPFEAVMQYGDGRVESCVIGASDAHSSFSTSDPEHHHAFFRICRRVIVPGCVETPLPEAGYWIPPHPVPRSAAAYAHGLSNVRDLRRPVVESPVEEPAQAPIHRFPAPPLEPAPQPPVRKADVQPLSEGTTPAKGNFLLCWVGKVDLNAALRDDTLNPGPIRMLLEHVPPFDRVVLLLPAGQNNVDLLASWLKGCVGEGRLDIVRTEAIDLSDHASVTAATLEAVRALQKRWNLPPTGEGITFHLSPGSPVTHAVMMLLAALHFPGVRLVQTKLTGLGKDPDVITVALPEDMAPARHQAAASAAPVAPAAESPVAPAESATEDLSPTASIAAAAARARRKAATMPQAKTRGKLKGKALLARFRDGHVRPHVAQVPVQFQAQPQAPARPAPLPVSGTVAFDEMDLPLADDTELRVTQSNIGKPARPPATAPMPKEGEPPMISRALGTVYRKMQRVAGMLLPILLLGESGSGKSRLARYIHEWSGRTGKFVSIDCLGLTDDVFFTELFGRSANTGLKPREGVFRKARTGTVFLENVHVLTPTQQSVLARVLAPVGETKITLPPVLPYPAATVRVRVIASATPELLKALREGRFRTDLYYRLAGVSASLPSVRDYSYEERENLLRSFLVSLQQQLGLCWNFSGDAWQALIDEDWPGNLREVARVLQQICLLSEPESTITKEDVLQQLYQSRIDNPLSLADHPRTQAREHGDIPDKYAKYAPIFLTGEDEDEEDADDEGEYDEDGLERLSRMEGRDGHPAAGNDDFFVLGGGENIDDVLSGMRLSKIVEAMRKTNGDRREAARLLGLTTVQLNYTLKRLARQARHEEKDEEEED